MSESTFTWATVTAVAPLRIKLDGDTVQLPFTPESLIDPAALAVDARVRCEVATNRVIVVGRSGGDSAAIAALINAAVPVGKIEWYAGATAPSAAWLVCDGSAVSRSTYATLFALLGITYGAGNGSTTFNLPDLRQRAPVGANTAASLGTATFANATDIITVTGHGLVDGDLVYFTGGTMPTGLTASVAYYVRDSTANTFKVATTLGGAAVNFTTDGSGTRTAFAANYLLGTANGESKHTLLTAELAAHSHTVTPNIWQATGSAIFAGGAVYSASVGTAAATSSAGGDRAHNNLQPYLALTPMIKALAAV